MPINDIKVNSNGINFEKNNVMLELKKEVSKFDELQSLLSKEKRLLLEIKKQIPVFSLGQTMINCDPVNNHDFLIAISKFAIENKKTPVIVLTSTNYKTLQKFFNESKLPFKDFFVIDTVSKSISLVNDSENIFFVDSLRNLTQLQIKLVKLLIKKNDLVLIFDSINVLGLYHSDRIIYKFIYSLTKIVHKYKTSSFFIVNKKSLVQKIGQFCDNIIEIGKIE